MKQVRIIDRASGRNVQYRLREESAVIKVTAGSTVQIAASRESIIAWQRDGNDLLLRFADGTTLRLQDYFECLAEDFNELILVESREDTLRVILEGEFCAAPLTESGPLTPGFEPVAVERASDPWFWTGFSIAGAAAAYAFLREGGRSGPPSPTVNPSNGQMFSGTARPGTTVHLDLDGDGTPDISTTTNADGTWSITPPSPVPHGTVVSVIAEDGKESSRPVQVMIDAVAPAAPEVTTYTGEKIAGTAEPGSAVSVDVDGDGEPDYTAVADGDGNWSIDLAPP